MKITIIKEPSERKKRKQERKNKVKSTCETNAIKDNISSIKSRSVFILIIALLIFVISCILKPYVNIFDNEISKLCLESIIYIFENISGIVLGISISSILLDFFSYVKYTQERIQEVIIDKKFLRTIRDEEKRKMINTLESSLYFKDKSIPADSLYINLKEKIIPLIEKAYCVNYRTYIDCDIKDDTVHKTVHNDMTVYSPKDNYSFKLPFQTSFSKDDIKSIKEPWKLTTIELNGKEVDYNTSDTCSKEFEESFDKKQVAFYFDRELILKKGENKIRYTTHSTVNISDNIYGRTLTLPCKKYTADFHINNEDYFVKVVGFAIDKEKVVETNEYNHGCRIEFLDWTLPGDGCVFVINKKQPISK